MSPQRWVLEARKPEVNGDGQPHEPDTEPGADEPQKDDAVETEDTEGLGFRFPNARSRSRRSSAQKSRPA